MTHQERHQQINAMEPGQELDKMVAELVMDMPPKVSWEVLSPDNKGSAFSSGSKREADDWLADILERMPESWLKDRHVGPWYSYPHYSENIREAWEVFNSLNGQGNIIQITADDGGDIIIVIGNKKAHEAIASVIAPTFPEAICKAALLEAAWRSA